MRTNYDLEQELLNLGFIIKTFIKSEISIDEVDAANDFCNWYQGSIGTTLNRKEFCHQISKLLFMRKKQDLLLEWFMQTTLIKDDNFAVLCNIIINNDIILAEIKCTAFRNCNAVKMLPDTNKACNGTYAFDMEISDFSGVLNNFIFINSFVSGEDHSGAMLLKKFIKKFGTYYLAGCAGILFYGDYERMERDPDYGDDYFNTLLKIYNNYGFKSVNDLLSGFEEKISILRIPTGDNVICDLRVTSGSFFKWIKKND